MPLTPGERAELKRRIDEEVRKRIVSGRAVNEDDIQSPVDVTLALLCALGKLTPNEREAWIDRRILRDRLPAIAGRMGCSKQNVCALEHRATAKLAATFREWKALAA